MKKESFGDLTDRISKKVQDRLGEEKAKIWWETENPHFGGMKPYDYLFFRPDKIERVIDVLISGEGP